MVAHAVDASLVADSSQSAAMGNNFAIIAALTADSNQAADLDIFDEESVMLLADSSIAAAMGVNFAVASPMTADSSQANALLAVNFGGVAAILADSSAAAAMGVNFAIDTSMLADSSVAGAMGVNFAVASAIAADSEIGADLVIFDESMICICAADSSMTADAFVAKLCEAQILAGAFFTIDPVGVVIKRTAQGSGVPSTAKPPIIPTIRITPSKPKAPSYSVSANPRRRREER